MTQNEREIWICTENIARYQKLLSEPPDRVPRKQLENLLVRELAKLQEMSSDYASRRFFC
jgi:hypothetical protein